MLRTGESVLTASVRIYEENGKYVGYAIDFIGVVISGLQIAGGIGVIASSVPTGNVLSIIAGATLVLNGVSSAAEGIQKLAGEEHPNNFMRDGFQGRPNSWALIVKWAYWLINWWSSARPTMACSNSP